jgi:ribonucleoside-triphosphate reductase (formate)
MEQETTDITLFVMTSTEDAARWNRQRIVDALIRETNIDVATAEVISKEVEKQLVSSGINLLTAPLIRELVDAKLIERGLEQARKMHARIGFPLYDVGRLILLENKENANLPHGPEGTNLILAEGIKREYALLDVFSSDVAEAHVMGDFHIHALGFVDRPYSSCQSLEYLKKFGLNLPHALTVAKPAKHAEVLLAHMVRFSATLQGHFAGVIAWDAVNFSFAPYLAAMDDKEVMQFAQMLIYEFSQLTSARGGQSMFTDIHLYWDLPHHLEGGAVIGPEGEKAGSTCVDFLHDARRFAWAILEVFKKGDARGMPFIFPRPIVHIGKSFFQAPGHGEFLKHICEVAGEKGNTCFAFDRGNWIRTSCGSINTAEAGEILNVAPVLWEQRCFAIQNVTLNLPRLAYKAAGDDGRLFSLITDCMELAAKAHCQKRDFIEKLLSYGDSGPLAMLTMKNDGFPYLKMNKAAYLMGMTGLNELVTIHKGKELNNAEALAFGLKTVAHMHAEAERLSRLQGMHFLLEQTPAETTAYRFARLDLKYFSPEAGHHVRGNLAAGEIYYTNSTQLPVSAPVSPMERAKKEGMFHPLIRGSVMTNVWLGDFIPDPGKLADFVSHVFFDTLNDYLLFSPEFVTCAGCGITSRGLREICPVCGSRELEGIARITQYFSRTSGWNKGKLAEIRDRKKHMDFTDL